MKSFNLRSKKVLITLSAFLTIGGLGTVAALTGYEPTSATEETPLVKDVRHQGEVLDNHEARITNAENDVSDLQKNTGTASSTTRVSVPSVSSPPTTSTESNPDPVAQPASVVVANFEKIDLGSGNIDCKFTYSDGTTYQWHWQTVNPQGAWATDGQEQNGHWVASTNNIGYCEQRVIGEVKR